jgi:2-phospho-L-lactate guanylyltransferase
MLVALVPVKALARAKSRLAGTLDAPARAHLMHDTLRRTVQTLRQVDGIDVIAVITRDPEVSAWAAGWGARVVHEQGEGLNESLREARAQFSSVQAVLVIPADLGWLAVEDIRAMLALAGDADTPAVVIAPDRHEHGTNGLLLQPPDIIDFCFGLGSAQEHAARAAARGVTAQWYHSSSISLDVDDPDDLALYEAAPYLL